MEEKCKTKKNDELVYKAQNLTVHLLKSSLLRVNVRVRTIYKHHTLD